MKYPLVASFTSRPESRQLQLTNVTIIRPDSRSTTGS